MRLQIALIIQSLWTCCILLRCWQAHMVLGYLLSTGVDIAQSTSLKPLYTSIPLIAFQNQGIQVIREENSGKYGIFGV